MVRVLVVSYPLRHAWVVGSSPSLYAHCYTKCTFSPKRAKKSPQAPATAGFEPAIIRLTAWSATAALSWRRDFIPDQSMAGVVAEGPRAEKVDLDFCPQQGSNLRCRI